jgi:hypothetical protein
LEIINGSRLLNRFEIQKVKYDYEARRILYPYHRGIYAGLLYVIISKNISEYPKK